MHMGFHGGATSQYDTIHLDNITYAYYKPTVQIGLGRSGNGRVRPSTSGTRCPLPTTACSATSVPPYTLDAAVDSRARGPERRRHPGRRPAGRSDQGRLVGEDRAVLRRADPAALPGRQLHLRSERRRQQRERHLGRQPDLRLQHGGYGLRAVEHLLPRVRLRTAPATRRTRRTIPTRARSCLRPTASPRSPPTARQIVPRRHRSRAAGSRPSSTCIRTAAVRSGSASSPRPSSSGSTPGRRASAVRSAATATTAGTSTTSTSPASTRRPSRSKADTDAPPASSCPNPNTCLPITARVSGSTYPTRTDNADNDADATTDESDEGGFTTVLERRSAAQRAPQRSGPGQRRRRRRDA